MAGLLPGPCDFAAEAGEKRCAAMGNGHTIVQAARRVRVTPLRAGQGRMFDMLTTFKNATIIDGSGMASFKGSVLVEGERIAAVVPASGEIPSSNPDTMIDCEGLSIMPGMTEAHCHISFNDLSSMYQAVEI